MAVHWERVKRQRQFSFNKIILDSDSDKDEHHDPAFSNTTEIPACLNFTQNSLFIAAEKRKKDLNRPLEKNTDDVSSDSDARGVLSESLSSSFDSEEEQSQSEESGVYTDEDEDDFVVSDGHVEFQDGTVASTSDCVEDSSSYFKKELHIEKEKDRFKVFIHYVLGCILDKDFQSSTENTSEKDEYFEPCVKYFYDKLLIVAKSTLQSGRWKEHFLENLNHLPFYKKKELVEAVMDKCQVCNKTHTSLALKVEFYGRKYFPEKFKLDLRSTNTKSKHPDPGYYSITYVIGRHCFNRSSRYHAIIHYMKYIMKGLRKVIQKEKRKVSNLTNQDALKTLIEEDQWMDRYYDGFVTISTIYRDSDSPWFTDSWWNESF